MSALGKIEAIATARGSNLKKDILRTLTPADRSIFELAFDPSKIFFYQIDTDELPPPAGEPGIGDDEAARMLREILLEWLAPRKVVGDEADKVVRNLFSQFTERQQKWFRKILNKDLGIGVEAKTYISVWKGAFKVFECSLAEPYDGQNLIGYIAEPKFDGLRVVATPDPVAELVALTRNGNLLFGMDHIIEMLKTINKRSGIKWVYDGEGVGPAWRDYAQARRKSNITQALDYRCFDMLTQEEWDTRKTPPLIARKQRMSEVFNKYAQELPLKLTEGKIISEQYTAKQAMTDACEQGFEGIVAKNPNAPYEWKRTGNWVKFKPRENVDMVIVGAAPGKAGKQYADSLGALVVEYNGITSEVGTGYSRDDRARLWQMYKEGTLVGKYAEIEKGPLTKDGHLFHASFKRLRLDK